MTASPDDSANDVLRVVSVSLGSSKRSKMVETELLGRRVRMERISVEGDAQQARELIAELDGHVAAIGLGGTDLYLVAGNRRYVIEQSRRLAEAAETTPVVDGSGLKNTLERETIRWLAEEGGFELRGKRVLVVSAVDRFGMAEGFAAQGSDTIFGDLIFALHLPIPVRTLRSIRVLAALLLPILRRCPISMLYPTGKEQEQSKPKYGRFFAWAEIIAGDFLFMLRHLPQRLDGKMIVTNTTTPEDVELLRARGLSTLVTTTPELEGRSFGTNVWEGVLVALAGKRPEDLQPEDYLDLLRRIGWQPRVTHLQTAAATPSR